jgi:DNA-binding NtrC family response regulator
VGRSVQAVAVYPETLTPPKSLLVDGARLHRAQSSAALLALVDSAAVGVVALCITPESVERTELLRSIKSRAPEVWCIVIGRSGAEEVAVIALRAGADEYIAASEVPDSPQAPPKKRPARAEVPSIVAGDRVSHRVVGQLDRIAATSSTVLITGETGTGKEMAARYIHGHGERQAQPFISVNCAAVPDTLLESELFGHERGAFTGAQSSADGKFHQAHRGTLFLDEIADMTPAAQAKILRVLETREVWRLGASRGATVNVRIIAATNQDVERLVAEGRFRSDLYYRLNVARVALPPLRERPSDIPVLIAHYVHQMNLQFGRKLAGFTEASMKRLQSYGWPGNVRELKNVVEAAFIDLPAGRVHLADLPESIRERLRQAADAPENEAARIVATLNQMHWNVSRAAQILRLSRMTLYRKIAKYGLSRTAKSA